MLAWGKPDLPNPQDLRPTQRESGSHSTGVRFHLRPKLTVLGEDMKLIPRQTTTYIQYDFQLYCHNLKSSSFVCFSWKLKTEHPFSIKKKTKGFRGKRAWPRRNQPTSFQPWLLLLGNKQANKSPHSEIPYDDSIRSADNEWNSNEVESYTAAGNNWLYSVSRRNTLAGEAKRVLA